MPKFKIDDLVCRKHGEIAAMQVTQVYPNEEGGVVVSYNYETMWHCTGCPADDDISEDALMLLEEPNAD